MDILTGPQQQQSIANNIELDELNSQRDPNQLNAQRNTTQLNSTASYVDKTMLCFVNKTPPQKLSDCLLPSKNLELCQQSW